MSRRRSDWQVEGQNEEILPLTNQQVQRLLHRECHAPVSCGSDWGYYGDDTGWLDTTRYLSEVESGCEVDSHIPRIVAPLNRERNLAGRTMILGLVDVSSFIHSTSPLPRERLIENYIPGDRFDAHINPCPIALARYLVSNHDVPLPRRSGDPLPTTSFKLPLNALLVFFARCGHEDDFLWLNNGWLISHFALHQT